jgi:hypothetical protein
MSSRFTLNLTALVSLILVFGLSHNSIAQRYPSQEEFGKNRVQLKTFKWKVFRTTNFEVYHYQGGTALAKLTAQYAENEFDKITDILGWTPYDRVKIFLYNSPAELGQSNMGLSTSQGTHDDKFNMAQSRIEVAYTGDQIGFKKNLVKEISTLFVYDMLYGGNIKEALQSSLLLSLPEWFMPGTAAYISEGWSPELNDYMRDFFKNRNVRKPTLLTGNDAQMVGHSIWNYIAERYGQEKISDILNLTRIVRNEHSSITSTLGVESYNRFLREWRDHYIGKTKSIAPFFSESDAAWSLKLNEMSAGELYPLVRISPDKRWTAISQVKNGRYHVILKDNNKGSQRTISKGASDVSGIKQVVQPPLLAWSKNNQLAVLEQSGSLHQFSLYENFEGKKTKLKVKRTIKGMDRVVDMDISNDASMLALSANRAGQNDLFLVSVSRGSIIPLTNDLYDDFSPKFVQGSSRRVVFASNRNSDSLSTNKGDIKTLGTSISIFEHDGVPGGSQLLRLTHPSSESKASVVYADDNDVYYLSNASQLSNLFKLDRKTGNSNQLTNYFFNIRNADLRLESGGALAYVYLKGGSYFVGYKDALNPNVALSGPASQSNGPAQDSAVSVESPEVKPKTQSIALGEGEVDTDFYEFDEEVLSSFNSSKPRSKFESGASALSRIRPKRETISIKGPYNYKGLLLKNDAETDWRIDPIRGFGYAQSLSMNDLLENHKFKAGFFVTADFKNSDLFGEYMNYTGRIDFGVRIDRKTLFLSPNRYDQKNRFNQIMLIASYPISQSSRFVVAPMFTTTRMIDVINMQRKDALSTYGGIRGEFVFDNTSINGTNMMEGTRFKIRFDNYAGLSSSKEGFNRLSLDFRHYQKIHRDLILAIRLSGSRSAGNAPKQSILGGMENWIGNKVDNRPEEDPLNFEAGGDYRDIFFADFATNLRGFNINKLSGNNYMLGNAELRIPIVKYLYRGSLTSSFLRNFQLVGFGDIGTAWTGKGPFSEGNNLNTKVIGSDPFYAIVTDYRNPFLIGYGVGVRTTLFGFYAKFDYAWGIDNRTNQKAKPYVTIGYDF